jgi:poly(U)-specific endoribonuclease
MSIYQEIWDADQQENGIPALRKKDQLQFKDETIGYVIIDEEANDTEARIVSEVVIPESKRLTYDLCARLFDNYALDPGIREDVTDGESQEERDFIRAIIPTKPLQIAKEFIARDLAQTVTDTDLALMIEQTWFLQGKAGSKFASGFEHVFVGEQKPTGDQPDTTGVTLGGYHFWYKYYLDDGGKIGNLELDDRVVYKGTRYGGATNTAQGILVPEVVTISFEWNAPDTLNQSQQRLQKPIGGFWVGCSPEGLIALGLVRVLTSAGSSVVINSSTYKFEFFPLDNNSQSIRTLFPRFIRTDFIEISPGDERESGADEENLVTDGNVKIVAALVNPSGDESGKETVTLLNIAPTAVALDGWQIKAPNGWEFTFADVTIRGGESHSFTMISFSPQFRNREGTITLLEPTGKIHDQVRYTKEDASREGFTIKF